MKPTARVIVVLVALTALTASCSTGPTPPPPSPTSSATPTPTRPATASLVAQEAFRALNEDPEKEPDWQTEACANFAPDALYWSRIGKGATGETVPMTKWCGPSAEGYASAGYETKGQVPTIEEEIRRPSERWVRVQYDGYNQYIAALVEGSDGWMVERWCSYGVDQTLDSTVGGDDPFYCLKQTS